MSENYSVNAVISAVDKSFSSTFRNAAKTMDNFQAGTQTGLGKVGTALTRTGSFLTKGVTLPLGLMAVAAAKTSMDFNSQMSRVQAISGATGKQMGAMKKQAIDLGAKTSFSAKQAAEGMENLASAGMNSNQIMKAMPGVLNLAAVSGGDVAKAAENMSTALNAFGLSAGKSSHVADVFAKAAAKTNAEASDMGEALKYVAPQAHAAGLSLEETSAAIGLLSDNGLKGSTAGTTLAQALQRVQKPSAEAQKAMDKLGFSAYDSGGKMKPLAKQVSDLKSKMKGMTDEQKANYLATIYGMEGGRAMNVLLGEQDGKLAALTKSLKNSKGSAADMAKIMQDNAKSAVEQLGGAFESAAIVIGDKMAPTIKNVANAIAGMVAKFNNASPVVQNFILTLLGIAAAIGPLMMLGGKIMTLTAEFATMAQSLGGYKALVNTIGKIMVKAFAGAAVIGGILLIVDGFKKLYSTSSTFKGVVDAVASAVGGALSGAFKIAGGAIKVVADLFSSLNKATGGVAGPMLEIAAGAVILAKGLQTLGIMSKLASVGMAILNGVMALNPYVAIALAITAVVAALTWFFTQTKTGQKIVQTVVDAMKSAWTSFSTFMSGLWQGIVTVASTVWTSLVTFMTPVITAIKNVWNTLVAFFQTLWTTIVTVATTVWTSIVAGMVPIITAIQNLWNVLVVFFQVLWTGIVTVATAIWNTLVAIFTPIVTAIIAVWQVISPFFAGLWQGIVTIATTVWDVIVTVIQTAVTVVQAVITAVMGAISATWTAIWNVIGNVVTAVWNVISTVVSTAINVVAGVIKAVTAAIQGDWSGAWNAIKGVAQTIWNAIKSIISTLINAVKSVITNVLNGIKSVWSSVWNGIKSVASSVWSGIKSVITSAINGVKSVISSVMNGIKSTMSNVWNGIKSAASSAWSGIKSIVSNGIRGALNAVKSVGSSMLSAGRDFVMGFVKGITGAIGQAASAAARMAKSAVDAAKSFMHIKSPSRVMRNEVGKYVALGMAVGIQKNTGAVIDASEAMAKAAIPDTDQFKMADIYDSMNTGLSSNSLTGAMEHELSVANNWTVEVPVNLDGDEVARITAKPMQKELNRQNMRQNRLNGNR